MGPLHDNEFSLILHFQVLPFEDDICVREPCLNFEECTSTLKFGNATDFISSDSMLFRPIHPVSTFKCNCPKGFTGELINLCFSFDWWESLYFSALLFMSCSVSLVWLPSMSVHNNGMLASYLFFWSFRYGLWVPVRHWGEPVLLQSLRFRWNVRSSRGRVHLPLQSRLHR